MKSVAVAIEDPSPSGIAGTIARLIASGDLAPGDRLPTVRELAAELGVSPATVSHAWQALAGVGLIISRGRSGSFVRAERTTWLPPRIAQPDRASGCPPRPLDRNPRSPAAARPRPGALARLEPRGNARATSTNRSSRSSRRCCSRPGRSSPGVLTIVDGAMDAISRTLDLLLKFGDRVAVENPGFPPVFDLLDHYGTERIPVELDGEGMRPDSLAEALHRSPAAIVLQPRTQNPSGVSMTVERARELARIIRNSRSAEHTLIIEDDHSGEISSSGDVSLGHVPAGSRRAHPQLLEVARPRPAHRGCRRTQGLHGPARRPTHPRPRLDLADAADHPVRPAHRAGDGRPGRPRPAHLPRAAGCDRGRAPRQRRGIVDTADGINLWLRVDDERDAVVQLAAAGIRVAAGTPFLATPGGQFIRVTVGQIRDDFASVAPSWPPPPAPPNPTPSNGQYLWVSTIRRDKN